ncbi:hypothetical protein REA38_11595 [Serratia sp. MF2]|uniref:hypothetical protein n=1 Tax=Serratia sp. MF1(2023) TaxID=3059171 RepID=UPI0027F0032E|nr:hypothetical protein [Serratia sp. MF1(2023)]MDQ7104193.1 hypothetical protein [Serratia sp. MF1(2023)]
MFDEENFEMKTLIFFPGALVEVKISGEHGRVEAATQHLRGDNTYLVRYLSANGQAMERTFEEHEIKRSTLSKSV